MMLLSGLLAGLFSFLSFSLNLFAAADVLTLPLRIATGEAVFSFLDGVLP